MVLKSRVLAPDWSANDNPDREAKCRKFPLPTNHVVNADTDPWFYDEEESALVCNGTYDDKVCPFRDRCLYNALVNNEQAGTFGGFTLAQRRWVRRQSRIDPDEQTFIGRDEWDEPDNWRHLVPDPQTLAALEDESDDEDEDSED